MDAISAITSTSTGSTGGSERNDLGREQFMQILISELVNQNPLEPMDNKDLLNQMVSMEELNSTQSLTETLETFQSFQEMSTASTMIGRTITAIKPDGTRIEGPVDSVSMRDGQAHLNVDGEQVTVDLVREIAA